MLEPKYTPEMTPAQRQAIAKAKARLRLQQAGAQSPAPQAAGPAIPASGMGAMGSRAPGDVAAYQGTIPQIKPQTTNPNAPGYFDPLAPAVPNNQNPKHPDFQFNWQRDYPQAEPTPDIPLPAVPEGWTADEWYMDRAAGIERRNAEALRATSNPVVDLVRAGDKALMDAGGRLAYKLDPQGKVPQFISENVTPAAQKLMGGLASKLPYGETMGPMGEAIGGGLSEFAATTARNPVQGMSEATDMLEPTHYIARGANSLGEAGSQALAGNWDAARQAYMEATPDLLIGTVGVVPFGSATVAGMQRAVQAPRAALRAEAQRALGAADDLPTMPPGAAQTATQAQPSPAPVTPQAVAPPAAQAGPQFFDPKGDPLDVKIVARSETGSYVVQTKDGREVIVGFDGVLPQSARSPDYVPETMDFGGRKISDLSDEELAALKQRAEEKIKVMKTEGQEQSIPSMLGERNAATYEQKRRAAQAASSSTQPTVPQAPRGAAQPGATGAGQQAAGAVPPGGPATLQASPTVQPVRIDPQVIADNKAAVTAVSRFMRAARVPRNHVNDYVATLLSRYEPLQSERYPLAFFIEDDLPQYLQSRGYTPEQARNLAGDVIAKTQGWGRAANSFNASGNSSRYTMQDTIHQLTTTQKDELSGTFREVLGDETLIGRSEEIGALMRQNGQQAYTNSLAEANRVLRDGTATAAQARASTELQTILKSGGFSEFYPESLKIEAATLGKSVDDLIAARIAEDPMSAAHWLQSEIGQAARDARNIDGSPTNMSRAYDKMREAILSRLETFPGYRGARMQHGDLYGADDAVSFGDRFLTVAKSDYQTDLMAKEFNALSPRQQQVAALSIRDALLNPLLRTSPEDAAARITQLQNEGTLKALVTVLGEERGQVLRNAISNTRIENQRIAAISQAAGSNTHLNQQGAKDALDNIRGPGNKIVHGFGNPAGWSVATGLSLATQSPIPLALKAAGSVFDAVTTPTKGFQSRATRGLYGLRQADDIAPSGNTPNVTPEAGALPKPPSASGSGKKRMPPPAPRGPRPPPTAQELGARLQKDQEELQRLLRQYDQLDRTDPNIDDLMRANLHKQGLARRRIAEKTKKLEALSSGPAPKPATNALAESPKPPPAKSGGRKPPQSNASATVTGAVVGGGLGAAAPASSAEEQRTNILLGIGAGAGTFGGIRKLAQSSSKAMKPKGPPATKPAGADQFGDKAFLERRRLGGKTMTQVRNERVSDETIGFGRDAGEESRANLYALSSRGYDPGPYTKPGPTGQTPAEIAGQALRDSDSVQGAISRLKLDASEPGVPDRFRRPYRDAMRILEAGPKPPPVKGGPVTIPKAANDGLPKGQQTPAQDLAMATKFRPSELTKESAYDWKVLLDGNTDLRDVMDVLGINASPTLLKLPRGRAMVERARDEALKRVNAVLRSAPPVKGGAKPPVAPAKPAVDPNDPFGDKAWAAQKKMGAGKAPKVEPVDTSTWTPEDFRAAQVQLNRLMQERKTAPAADWMELDTEIAQLRQALELDGPAPPKPPAQAGFGGNRSLPMDEASRMQIEGVSQKLAEAFDQDIVFDDVLDVLAKDKSMDKARWLAVYGRMFGSTDGVVGGKSDVIDTLRRERVISVRNRKARAWQGNKEFEPYRLPPSQEGSSKLLAGFGRELGAGGAAGVATAIAGPRDINGDGVIDEQERAAHSMSVISNAAIAGGVTRFARSAFGKGGPKPPPGKPPAQAGFGGGKGPPGAKRPSPPPKRNALKDAAGRAAVGAAVGTAISATDALAQSAEMTNEFLAPLEEERKRIRELEDELNIILHGTVEEKQAYLAETRGLKISASGQPDGRLGPDTRAAIVKARTDLEAALAAARDRENALAGKAETRRAAIEQQMAFERTNPSDAQQAFRDWAPLVGATVGAVGAKSARLLGVGLSKPGARAAIAKSDALLSGKSTIPASVKPAEINKRASNLNEFWQRGGATSSPTLREKVGLPPPKGAPPNGVPFETSPKTGDWKARPSTKVTPPQNLFPDKFIGSRLRSGDVLIGGTGVIESYLADQHAQKVKVQLEEARLIARDDPSEKNLARVQSLEDQYATAKAWSAVGAGVAAGTILGLGTSKYASRRANVPQAERELAQLRRYLASQGTPVPPTKPVPPPKPRRASPKSNPPKKTP